MDKVDKGKLAMVRGRMLSVREAADRCGQCVASLYNAMGRGELVYVKLGKSRRIPEAALEQWLLDHLQGGWAAADRREV